MLGHPLGLPMGQTHMPHERFNLFHIDNAEMHFESLNASVFINDHLAQTNEELNLESQLLL